MIEACGEGGGGDFVTTKVDGVGFMLIILGEENDNKINMLVVEGVFYHHLTL